MTMSALLIMTDWQAIGYDPCTALSIFHNPNLAEEYRTLANDSAVIKTYNECSEYSLPGCNIFLEYSAVYDFIYNTDVDVKDVDCVQVSECPACSNTTKNCVECLITGDCQYSNQKLVHEILCKRGSSSRSCYKVDDNYRKNMSVMAEVHIQSLKVVRDSVYDFAERQCESVQACQWIPNSRVTHHHCHDCQPICRSKEHTLKFVQFTVGLSLLMCTMEVMYIGMFLLISDSVSKKYQVIRSYDI